METEKKNGRGKKEVSLLGLFGKKFLEETQGKLAEATGISFFIIDYNYAKCKFLSKDDILWNVYCLIRLPV